MVSKKELQQMLSQFSSFVITTHKNCDGDGLGAGLALYHALKKKGKKVEFVTLDKIPDKYSFLESECKIKIFDKNNFNIDKKSLLIVVDTNDFQFIEPLYSFFDSNEVIFIDHHPLVNHVEQRKIKKDHYFIDTKASSTGEIIFSVLKDYKIEFDEQIATALYASIIFDTKMFRSIKNSSIPFAISSELIRYISDVNKIYNHLFKKLSTKNLEFYSQLKNIEYFFQKSFSILYLDKEVIKKYEADIGNACELLDLMMNVESVKATALIFEMEDGFKLSFRSADINILPIAKKFNGGGHHFSAGAFVSNKNLDELKSELISHFSNLLDVKKAS